MTRLLLASNNRHKWSELAALLDGLPYVIVTPADLGIRATIEEIGDTFAANARQKAEAFAGLAGCLALADDSGLVVDALGGEPGVLSARYGGDLLDDDGRTRLVLDKLGDTPWEQRTGRFVCVIALAAPGEDTRTFDGVVEGQIAFAPAGDGGFGYDPIFVPRGLDVTFAEIPAAEKHRRSHRGQAMALARQALAS